MKTEDCFEAGITSDPRRALAQLISLVHCTEFRGRVIATERAVTTGIR